MDEGNPLARDGHVSYLEIPAIDAGKSASFYEAVFGWQVQRRDAGHFSFDDGTGGVIGRWVPERAASRDPGILPYIYVDRINNAIDNLLGAGGEIVTPKYQEGDVWVATFRDPSGNLMGLWQFVSR
jgi:predicted enzyme related to lactoylglutathione lyase